MIRQMELRRPFRPIPAGSLYIWRFGWSWNVRRSSSWREHLNYDGPLRDLKKVCLAPFKPSGDRLDQRAFVLFQLLALLGWLPKDLLELNPGEWDVLVREVESFRTWNDVAFTIWRTSIFIASNCWMH
ncbi:MAG: hypothetical protein U0872_03965 [Planctomycetaceae bacterium]